MIESRTKNSKRNIYVGLVKQALNILFPFIIRTIIIYALGEMYQGLTSLFTSILHVLNLAELGFSSAVICVLYKPLADNDIVAVRSIINYLKRTYRIIGLFVAGVGIVAGFLLPYLISGEYPADVNIYILYAIYLVNTVISYFFFAYKSALLTAIQREDIVSNTSIITTTLLRVAQIVLLLTTKNFYAFAIVIPLFTFANNILLQYFSKKYFPQYYPDGNLSPLVKANLHKNIKGVLINRVGDVARNSFDNLIISALFGLSLVAVYDNYYYVYSALYGISLVFTHGMQASVGNSISKESTEKNLNDLNNFTFLFSLLMGWCAICMACLYQPFMTVWMNGKDNMLLSDANMLLFCVYFYAITMNNTRNLYINGVGLFWECRLWFIMEAVGNLLLNFLFGYFFGITGVILATIITIFVFNFITRTNILFKSYFKISPAKFYLSHLLYAAVTLIIGAITYFICYFINFGGFVELIIKLLICIVVPAVLYILMYLKTKRMKNSLLLIKKILKRKN